MENGDIHMVHLSPLVGLLLVPNHTQVNQSLLPKTFYFIFYYSIGDIIRIQNYILIILRIKNRKIIHKEFGYIKIN